MSTESIWNGTPSSFREYLTIHIPLSRTMAHIKMDIQKCIQKLRYLETSDCKKTMTEEQRRKEIKETTEKFKKFIIERDTGEIDSLYN